MSVGDGRARGAGEPSSRAQGCLGSGKNVCSSLREPGVVLPEWPVTASLEELTYRHLGLVFERQCIALEQKTKKKMPSAPHSLAGTHSQSFLLSVSFKRG